MNLESTEQIKTGHAKRALCRLIDPATFKLVEKFPTYEAAVIAGQQRLGRGKFMVETPGRVPSREEQLLQLSKRSLRAAVLSTL